MRKVVVMLAVALLMCGISNISHSQDVGSTSYETVVVAPEPAKPTSGYDGGFFVQSKDGKYKLVIGTRLDTMFYWQSQNTPDLPATPTLDESKDHLSFRLRRGSFDLKAIYNNKLSFKVAVTAGSGDNGITAKYLAYGKYVFNDYVNVTFGMFDPEYDLQNLFSTKEYTMVDYPIIMTQKDGEQAVWSSITESTTVARPSFGLPTELGLSLAGDISRFHWALSFGNGTEGTDTINRNPRFTYTLRLAYTILGSDPTGGMNDYNYSETPSLAVGLAGAFEHDKALRATTGAVMYNWSLDGAADTAFRYRGFAINLGGYYRQIKVGPGAVWEAGEKYLTDIGYIASVSMFAIAKKLEVQGWACQLIREGPDNNAYEFGGGINYYFVGPNAKFGIDYSRVVDYDDIVGANHGSTNRVRAKLQLYF